MRLRSLHAGLDDRLCACQRASTGGPAAPYPSGTCSDTQHTGCSDGKARHVGSTPCSLCPQQRLVHETAGRLLRTSVTWACWQPHTLPCASGDTCVSFEFLQELLKQRKRRWTGLSAVITFLDCIVCTSQTYELLKSILARHDCRLNEEENDNTRVMLATAEEHLARYSLPATLPVSQVAIRRFTSSRCPLAGLLISSDLSFRPGAIARGFARWSW